MAKEKEEAKCIIMQLRPKWQELRDRRTYTEPQVKRIMLGFAHDLGVDMSDEQLWQEIEETFNFG